MPGKITVAQLKAELDAARLSGSPAEAADLDLLLEHTRLPGPASDRGVAWLRNVAAARNRQAQRRYNRRTTRASNTTAARTARNPMVGDWVEDPSGARWKVTRLGPGVAWYDVPGQPLINCPFDYCKVVDGPVEIVAGPKAVQAPTPAGETLYHAIWDVLETEDFSATARNALETALRAYEASLP